jgi:hypothetical protein
LESIPLFGDIDEDEAEEIDPYADADEELTEQ